jgi:hypothetical protein
LTELSGLHRERGQDKRWYKCTNAKVTHITMTRTDIYGRTRPVYMPNCKWHLKACYNDHGNRFVRVAEPNEEGACAPQYPRIVQSLDSRGLALHRSAAC